MHHFKSFVGITTKEYRYNQAYIEGWIERLRKQPHLIFYASAQGQRSIDYILNLSKEEMEENDEFHPSSENLKN